MFAPASLKICKKYKERESVNRLNNLLFVKASTSAVSSSSVDVVEKDKLLPKSETSIFVSANVSSEFLSPKFLAHDAEIR